MNRKHETRPTWSRRRLLRVAGRGGLTAAALSILSACGARPANYLIRMVPQNQLDPSSLTIPQGSIVTWQNIGVLSQSVTCDPAKVQNPARVKLPPNAQPWDSGELYPGQTWSYTFNTPGMYLYYSRIQNVESMSGVITVTD